MGAGRIEFKKESFLFCSWFPCLQEASQFSMLDVIYIRKYLAGNQKATGERLCFAR